MRGGKPREKAQREDKLKKGEERREKQEKEGKERGMRKAEHN